MKERLLNLFRRKKREEITDQSRGIPLPLSFSGEERIKILYIVRPVAGGVKGHLLSLIDNLDKDKYQAFVAGPEESVIDDLKGGNVPTFVVDIEPSFRLIKDVKAVLRLRKIITGEGIFLVHAHSYKAALLAGLAARWAKVPVTMFTLHNFIVDEGAGRFKHLFYDLTERFLPSLADRVITVSKALRRRVIDKGKVGSSRVVMIHNGISIPPAVSISTRRTASLRHLLSLKSKAPLVVTVGRLVPQKGIKYLLTAATHVLRELPSAQFLIVGDGPLRRDLEVAAEKLGIHKKVVFIGFREDIHDILVASDVVVLPSLTEGLPLVALEAMAAGKPLVGTAVGGIPEVVVDRETGFLVPPRKPIPLAHAILFLLTNKEAALQMGMAGRRRVEEDFTLEKTITETQNIYTELIAEWEARVREEQEELEKLKPAR